MPRRRQREVIDFVPAPEPTGRCELCGREVPRRLITLHHTLPRQKGGKAEHRVPTCKPCHKQVHATFGNAELAKIYPTVDALREAPQLQPFLRWIRKQAPDRNFAVHLSNDHPGSKRQRMRRRR
jgi:hypothetical protein